MVYYDWKGKYCMRVWNKEHYLKKQSNLSALLSISKTLTRDLGAALDATFQERHGLIGEHCEESSEWSEI